MAELTGWPTDGAEGAVSSEARWRKMARLWARSGVATGMVPTAGAGVINVTAGSVWVDGHYAEMVTSASEASTANGLLVVRFTPADNTFELVYRDGITTPTQSDAVWELAIAQMVAGVLTDLRVMVGPGGRGRWTAGTQTITTGTTTTLAYVTPIAVDDPGDDFSDPSGTGVITIKNPGWYRVTASMRWTMIHTGAITAGTHDTHFFLIVSGANQGTQSGYMNSLGAGQVVSATLPLKAGDTVAAQCRQTTGANRTTDPGGHTALTLERVA